MDNKNMKIKYTEYLDVPGLFENNNTIDDIIADLQNLKEAHPDTSHIDFIYDDGYDYKSSFVEINYYI